MIFCCRYVYVPHPVVITDYMNKKKTNFRKSFKLKKCQFMLSHRKYYYISFEFNDIMAVADRCLNPFQYFKAKIVIVLVHFICINETISLMLPHNCQFI